jgi:hypothetical protein
MMFSAGDEKLACELMWDERSGCKEAFLYSRFRRVAGWAGVGLLQNA